MIRKIPPSKINKQKYIPKLITVHKGHGKSMNSSSPDRLKTTKCLRNQSRTKGEGWSTRKLVEAPLPPSSFIACRPKTALLFGSLVVLDVVSKYGVLFLLDIKIENRLKIDV